MSLRVRISSLLSGAKKSAYIRNIGWLVRGNILAQLIQVLALPLISRLYTPEDFGVFSLFVSFVGFAAIALSLRFESALLIANKKEVAPLVVISMWLVLIMGIVFTAILDFLQSHSLLGFGILPSWALFVMLITLMGHGFFNIGRSIMLRDGEVRVIAKARIEKSFSNIVCKLGAGIPELAVSGLLLGETVGAWFAFRRVGKGLFRLMIINLDSLRNNASGIWKNYRKFPLFELPSTLADQAALVLPVPMIAAIGGAEAAGAYGMARIIVALPNAQIGRAIADGFQWKLSDLVRQKKYNMLLPTLLKTAAGLAALGIIPFALLGIFSPWLFPLLLGQEWALSGLFAALITIWMYFSFVVTPISRLLSILKQQEYKLLYDFSVLIALLVLFIFAQKTEMEPLEFLSILVVINSVGYFLYGFVLIFVCRKFVNLQVAS